MHAIVLRNPAQIRSKKTAHFWYLCLYGREHSDYHNSLVSFRTNIFYLYEHE